MRHKQECVMRKPFKVTCVDPPPNCDCGVCTCEAELVGEDWRPLECEACEALEEAKDQPLGMPGEKCVSCGFDYSGLHLDIECDCKL